MLKLLITFIFGDWCKHDWQIIESNDQIVKESSAEWNYDIRRKFLLLKCNKCGKLTSKKV